MKKWLLRIGIVVVVLIVAAIVAGFLFLNSLVKTGVETVGPQIVKVDMKLASANISPLSGSGQLSGLVISNPEGCKTPDAIKVGDVKVNVQVSSLLSDTIVLESVNIQDPEITFEGGLGGNNLSKILDNLGGDTKSEDKKEDKPAEGGKKFKVKDLVVQGGKIHVSLTGMGGKTMTLPLPPLHLENIGVGGDGVSAAELSKQILKPLLASITTAVSEGISKLGAEVKEAGKEAAEKVGNAAKGLKNLFKK